MAAGLRKLADGRYIASGTLDAISGPGRRTVRWLELRNLHSGADLSALEKFTDLETLEIDHVTGIDLSAITNLPLKRLALRDVASIDLAPVTTLAELEVLLVLNFRDVRFPASLPATLTTIGLANDDPDLTGVPVKKAIEAIDWTQLGGLRNLDIRVGGLYEMEPIHVDLGFLRKLPALVRLDLYRGVRHSGSGGSPLDPPFDGLPTHLRWVRIDADDPDLVRHQLRNLLRIPVDSTDPAVGLSVEPRQMDQAPRPPWSIVELPDGEGWVAYGSLVRAQHGGADTEYDACRLAEARLRDADPELFGRLDFDPENAGTGIRASSSADLEAALAILGLSQ